jgi:hypothetical protein
VRSFQISAVFPHLTVLENVRVGLQRKLGTSFHFWKPESTLHSLNGRAMELLESVDLASFADTQTVELPYGRKRALEIATTLALDPELMLLDEPTQGMGHEDVGTISGIIRSLAKAARNTYIAMLIDPDSPIMVDKHWIPPEASAFYRTEMAYRGLFFSLTSHEVKVDSPVRLTKQWRIQPKSLQAIESLFETASPKQVPDDDAYEATENFIRDNARIVSAVEEGATAV